MKYLFEEDDFMFEKTVTLLKLVTLVIFQSFMALASSNSELSKNIFSAFSKEETFDFSQQA